MALILLLCERYVERLIPIYVLSPPPTTRGFQQSMEVKTWLLGVILLSCGPIIFASKVCVEEITNFQWLFGIFFFFFVYEVLSPLSQAFNDLSAEVFAASCLFEDLCTWANGASCKLICWTSNHQAGWASLTRAWGLFLLPELWMSCIYSFLLSRDLSFSDVISIISNVR